MPNMYTLVRPPYIFLLDGLGAALSAVLLGVLYYGQPFFGMPSSIVLGLLPFAFAFLLYSLCCYYYKPLRWRFYLMLIAIANMGYSLGTLYLVWIYFNQLTVLGLCYFLIETTIILLLVSWEFWLCLSARTSGKKRGG